MPLEQILAKNVTALMQRTPDLETIDKLSARSGVGRGTVDRIKKGEVSTKVETVEKLAIAFGVAPVQLLVDHGDPATANFKDPGPVEGPTLTQLQWLSDEEAQLLRIFRELAPGDRVTAKEIISVMPRVSRSGDAANEA